MGILGIYASSVLKVTNSYESIATVNVGSGGTSSITFSSIPSNYTHLQIRGIARNQQGTNSANTQTLARYNSDTANNYSVHQMRGTGSAVSVGVNLNDNAVYGLNSLYTGNSNLFNGFIIDILDYTNTNKYTTIKVLNGYDANGSGIIALHSGIWMSTSVINRIDLPEVNGSTYAEYSQFALYGIKG